ncbi:glycerate kinase [Streptomyces sp. ISL-12]|uniref:glycerate kinase family protein n=1 Tax=Streptomyces sp. ISL-12 TaxID=2819177 RepID=UPI001BE6E0CD|nr:glycerate kinase [Streptomyces sp. ISL-12]MBT2412474.1 glycerate kinase [Streptomyces sp. ISL-12]
MAMKVLVAPDSFKGTYTARQVAEAIGQGLADSSATPVLMPVADGGEGTLAALTEPLGLRYRTTPSRNPWGSACDGRIALAANGTAFIELADVCGIDVLHDGPRDPVVADTRGVGMLMVDAVRHGAREIVVAAGGSATSDGGIGALKAIEERGGLSGAKVKVLTDVTTPYVEAARVFGPQKGADPGQVAILTLRLHDHAKRLPRDPSYVPRTGAAGGFAGAMWARFDAELLSGADFVLDALGFDEQLEGADAVVVGEGRLDTQSGEGKIVSAVLARAGATPCFAIVGSVDPGLATMRDTFTEVVVAGDEAAMRAAGRTIARRLRLSSDTVHRSRG